MEHTKELRQRDINGTNKTSDLINGRDAIMADNKFQNVDAVAAYICLKMHEAKGEISILKLHKLLYYVQAWHLVLKNSRLMDTEFEAWVHGPVNRSLFLRYRGKMMYSEITAAEYDCSLIKALSRDASDHIDNVLNSYGDLTGSQLEQITHREDPWLKARGTLEPYEMCTNTISDEDMRDFYSKLLN